MPTTPSRNPRLGVFKFASCDGCQLSLLDAEDELLRLADKVEICYFLEATSRIEPGPYDVSLVEGSVTTPDDAQRIQQIRRDSRYLVAIGACATAGGIQALRNWADLPEFVSQVYPHPEYLNILKTSTPISDHVMVDFELRGCPINKDQLIEVLLSLIAGRKPHTPSHSVCLDCKRSGTVCVAVTQGISCLGPITQSGCGALCPSFTRGCYGCFGPVAQANPKALSRHLLQTGHDAPKIIQELQMFNAFAPEFREESRRLASSSKTGRKE